jgi:hypothetical protein
VAIEVEREPNGLPVHQRHVCARTLMPLVPLQRRRATG